MLKSDFIPLILLTRVDVVSEVAAELTVAVVAVVLVVVRLVLATVPVACEVIYADVPDRAVVVGFHDDRGKC